MVPLYILTLIGAVIGAAPALIALLVRAQERRNLSHKRREVLDEATKMLSFLEVSLRVEQVARPSQQLESARVAIQRELEQVLERVNETFVRAPEPASSLTEHQQQPLAAGESPLPIRTIVDAQPSTLEMKRTRIQRLLLIYTPARPILWVVHILFYMALGMVAVMSFAFALTGEGEMTWEAFSANIRDGELWSGWSALVVIAILLRLFAAFIESRGRSKEAKPASD